MPANYLSPPYKNIIFIFLYCIMSAKENIEIKIDNNVTDRNALFVKILQKNKEFVDFATNFSNKDVENLIKIIDLLKKKGTSTRSKTGTKKTATRRTSLHKIIAGGWISQEELRRYILMGVYFIYAAIISYGVYAGSDSIMVGFNQVTQGTCNSLTNQITGYIGLGTRHPFCNIFTTFTHTLLRAFTHGESSALATIAVYTATPIATIYIQKHIIEAIATGIANRLGEARSGQAGIEYNRASIAGTQNLRLSFPNTTAAQRAIIPQPEHDARTHPSRRSNISRRSRSRSRSSSPASRSGGRRLSKRKTMKRKTMKRRA
jgi:hypothetical protein